MKSSVNDGGSDGRKPRSMASNKQKSIDAAVAATGAGTSSYGTEDQVQVAAAAAAKTIAKPNKKEGR